MRSAAKALYGGGLRSCALGSVSWIRSRRLLSGSPRAGWLWVAGSVTCLRSLGLPFIQECRAFLSRPREADVLMSLLLKPRDDVSDLHRIDDVHNLSIRSVGEDGNKHQHCLSFCAGRGGSRGAHPSTKGGAHAHRAVNFEA